MMQFLLAALLAVAPAVFAASVSIWPSNPSTADTIVLQVDGAEPCAPLNVGPEMAGNVIRQRFTCGPALEDSPPRWTIGRLPAGSYTVQLLPANGDTQSVIAAIAFTVGAGSGLDNFSGHYVTNVATEGVFVTQYGNTAFISFLFMDTDGTSSWAVMPDARLTVLATGAEFTGAVWRFQDLPNGARLGTQTGFGTFHAGEGKFDRARIRLQIPQDVQRTLSRFRF